VFEGLPATAARFDLQFAGQRQAVQTWQGETVHVFTDRGATADHRGSTLLAHAGETAPKAGA
jgi:hypothetical protein